MSTLGPSSETAKPPTPESGGEPANRVTEGRKTLGVVAVLWLTVVLAYAGVDRCGFVNLDDDVYVEHQPLVNRGLRGAAIAWAFTDSHSGTWHPLASLSHALDCDLFGVNPRPMHWENVLLHALNAALVLLVWRRLFGGFWRAAAVAFLFALHPLNVESVAWISERKNLLSTLCWLLGLLAYANYVRQPTVIRYGVVAAAFLLGLLTKPMLVTFPCVLLLLDVWPLQRWPRMAAGALLKGKLLLFALTVLACVATIVAQAHMGATDYGKRFAFSERLGNAVVSYARYLGKLVWPDSLSAFYWHPGSWPTSTLLLALTVLIAITGLCLWQRRTRPALLFGWLWFLGTLVPVIGILQSGAQAMADRYAYVPALGIFTAVVWLLAEVFARSARARIPVVIVVGLACVALLLTTRRQVQAWRNSETLHRHSIAVGEDNAAVRVLLAGALVAMNRPLAEVIAEYQRALERSPSYVNALTQLAGIAILTQRPDEARALIEKSIALEPGNHALHHNLGSFWVRAGQPEQAVPHYERALQLNPKSAGAHHELAQIRLKQNRLEEALKHYEARARLERWNADAWCDYGTILSNARRFDEAHRALERAVWIIPDHTRARKLLKTLAQVAPQSP